MISGEFPYKSKYVDVLGSSMHYVEKDQPDAIGEALSHWLARLPTLC